MPNKIITILLENTDLSTLGKRLRCTIKNILAMNDGDFAASIGKSQNYILKPPLFLFGSSHEAAGMNHNIQARFYKQLHLIDHAG